MKYPFMPIGNQLLLAEIETSERSAGGIILPERVRKPVNQGKIVAMGDGVPVSDAFAIGCVVVFPLWSDSAVEWERKRFIIVPWTDILLSDFGFYGQQKNPS